VFAVVPFTNSKAQFWLVLIFVPLAIAAVRDVTRLDERLPWRQMSDFPDFYCAGRALNEGRSPYTYEPLHKCEQRISTLIFVRQNPTLVIPAPQPPYDFLPFMLLARWRFHAALIVYALTITVVMVAAAAGLSPLGVRFDIALLGFAIPGIYQEMAAGQVVPLALLFIVLAGVALSFRRDTLAGILTALVFIEPQFGVPVAITVFCYVGRARWTLIATLAIMALVATWIVTPSGLLDYVTHTLPAHSVSETAWPYQYSLTYALHFLEVPAQLAQGLGTLSSVATLAFALWLAPRLVAKLQRREMFAFFPAMCAVLGGPFIHNVEIPAAIPAVLILAVSLRGTLRSAAVIILCFLMLPWMQLWGIKKLFATSVLLGAAVLLRLHLSLRLVFATLACLAGLIFAFERTPPPGPPRGAQIAFLPTELASVAWQRITPTFPFHGSEWFSIKLPTWVALLAAFVVVACFALRGDAEDNALPARSGDLVA
jgi:hypothetical protein